MDLVWILVIAIFVMVGWSVIVTGLVAIDDVSSDDGCDISFDSCITEDSPSVVLVIDKLCLVFSGERIIVLFLPRSSSSFIA